MVRFQKTAQNMQVIVDEWQIEKFEDMKIWFTEKKINISYTDNSGPEEVTYIEYKHKLKIIW